MAFEANREYEVTATNAYFTTSTQKGTPGVVVTMTNLDGDEIDHTLWITPKTREGNIKAFTAMGVPEGAWEKDSFYDNVDAFVIGKKFSITTYAESFNGKPKVKVQWINPLRAAPALNAKSSAAAIMRGITGDDVPF